MGKTGKENQGLVVAICHSCSAVGRVVGFGLESKRIELLDELQKIHPRHILNTEPYSGGREGEISQLLITRGIIVYN